MTADVIPFAPVPVISRIKELERDLARAQEALLIARTAIEKLQREKQYREFYQWLATERLQQMIILRGQLDEKTKS
jgi:Ribonuclease G/E